MDKLCRVSVELEEYQRRVDEADRRGAECDERAEQIMLMAIGYRPSAFGDLSDLMDWADVSTELRADILDEYLGRLFAPIEKGVADDRHVRAREYLMEYIRDWADKAAEKEMNDDLL